MGDKPFKSFDFNSEWGKGMTSDELLPTYSTSTVSSSDKEKEGHSTTDSTIWCRKCHRKPCDYITKAALAETKKLMPKRWDLDPTSSGDSAGAVVVVDTDDPATAVVEKYTPTLKIGPFDETYFSSTK